MPFSKSRLKRKRLFLLVCCAAMVALAKRCALVAPGQGCRSQYGNITEIDLDRAHVADCSVGGLSRDSVMATAQQPVGTIEQDVWGGETQVDCVVNC